MGRVGSDGTSWDEAWRAAASTLEGVTRRRLAGASSDVEIAFLDWGGEGELIILHHANGFCAATFAPIAKRLSERFRVVSMDARGHGDSTSVPTGGNPNPYHWNTLAEDLHHFVPELLALTGHDRVALGIGHSFGGAMLLRAAIQQPESFDRLLLCDPVIRPPMTEEERAAHSAGNTLASATRKRRDRFPTREAAFEHCRTRGLYANFTAEALALYVGEGMRENPSGEIALKCDREVEAAIFDVGGASASIEASPSPAAEVVFVHAGRGNFSREHFTDLAAQMTNARVIGLDAGHLFPLEDPEPVLTLVDELMTNA